MRKFIYSIGLAIAILGLVTCLVTAGPFRSRDFSGSCGPGGCAVPQPAAASSVTTEWRPCELPNGDNRYVLWRGQSFLGFWDGAGNYYRAYLGNEQWADKVNTPPHPLPAWIVAKNSKQAPTMPKLKDWQKEGVDAEKIDGKEQSVYAVNGLHVSAWQAEQKLLEDDSGKLWLVVTGNGREQVIKDLNADPAYADLLKRTRVWSVPADHFSLLDRDTKKPFFANSGNPSITLMDAHRNILYEHDGYKGAADLQAIRKADPDFKPPPPPVGPKDPAKPAGPPAPAASNSINPMFPLCCVAALGGAYLLTRKAKP